MKNECSENSEAEIAVSNDRAKKLYRYVNDVARRVDDATAASRSVADLFTTYFEVQRQKLRDNCEKLLFLDPVNYGKKSLELLWRKVYYETVSATKKHREAENEDDNYLFTHIICGIGHFHHIIDRIQTEFHVQLKELDYTPLHKDEDSEENNETPNDELQPLGRTFLHSCLIYLGDLSRYQAEIFHTFDPSIAARYYLQAAHIDLSSGMPYNQLGNLYMDKNHNLDSVCYYIHCLNTTSPFEGALGNLTKLFEKNLQYVESISDNSDMLTQAEHIQNTIANFLSLIEIWYFSKDEGEISQKCNLVAQELKISLDFDKIPYPDMERNYSEYMQAMEEELLNPSYLNSNIIHKIIEICLFTIAKLNESEEKKAFSCKAFTLALLSQLLQKLLQQLKSLGFKNPADKYRKHSQPSIEPEALDETVTEKDEEIKEIEIEDKITTENNHKESNGVKDAGKESGEDNTTKLQNGDVKSKKLAKRRRRRRTASSDSSAGSESESSSSEDESKGSCSEEETESSYESEEDIKTDSSNEYSSDNEVPVNKQNGTATEETKPNDPAEDSNVKLNGEIKENGQVKHKTVKPQINIKKSIDAVQIQNFLRGDNFLPSIKLLQDWVLNEKDLILSCGESGESLFQCVVDLLNIFTYYFKPKVYRKNDNEKCKILEYARSVAKRLELEYKTIPLPEDLNLRGTIICKFDKDAAEWNLLDLYKPSAYEENVIRILNFIDFGYQIAQIIPRIRFNRSMQILYLKKIPAPKTNTKIPHKRTREWHNSKKQHAEGEGGLLRRLGKLWLAFEVRELEKHGRVNTPPTLLALDAAALNIHLKKVKQLLRTRIFILLIPTIVLQELDDLKREQSSARDAIRWLEVQLQGGSRFVRAQRPGQSRPLPYMKYPKRAPPHIHNYIQILEFCHHFVADEKQTHGGNGDSEIALQTKSTSLLVFLTGNDLESVEDQYKEFSVTGAANAAGITMEYIGKFYTKWRQTAHKSGKKR